MDDAFLSVTKEILADGPPTSSLAKAVITWVYYSNEIRCLHIEELRDLLAVKRHKGDIQPQDRPSQEQILAACHRLILCDQNSGYVRLTHPLIETLLLKHKDSKNSLLLPTEDLALCCLDYLFLDVFEQGKCATIEELEARTAKYKLAKYVCQYWGHYVRQAEENDQVQADTIALLANKPVRESLNQINDFVRTGELRCSGRRSLHIIAENGLALICNLVLFNRYASM
jgi:hypothetical protein